VCFRNEPAPASARAVPRTGRKAFPLAVFEDLRVTAPRETRHPKNFVGSRARDGPPVAESDERRVHERTSATPPSVSTGRQAIARRWICAASSRRSHVSRDSSGSRARARGRDLGRRCSRGQQRARIEAPREGDEVRDAQSVPSVDEIGRELGRRMVCGKIPASRVEVELVERVHAAARWADVTPRCRASAGALRRRGAVADLDRPRRLESGRSRRAWW